MRYPHKSLEARKATSRHRYIDYLRGIAAMLVVVYHLNQAITPAISKSLSCFSNLIFRWGHIGVNIFFVMSGFVIAQKKSIETPSVSLRKSSSHKSACLQ